MFRLDYKIRWAQEKDAQALGELHTASWQAAYKGIIPTEVLNNLDAERRTQKFKEAIKENKEETAVLLVEDKVVGFITLGKNRDEDCGPGTGEIWGIYLHPEYYNQGLGSELIQWGIKKLKKRGYKKITLWVLKDNESSRKFYEKKNFIFDGTVGEIKKGKTIKKVRYVYNIYD